MTSTPEPYPAEASAPRRTPAAERSSPASSRVFASFSYVLILVYVQLCHHRIFHVKRCTYNLFVTLWAQRGRRGPRDPDFWYRQTAPPPPDGPRRRMGWHPTNHYKTGAPLPYN